MEVAAAPEAVWDVLTDVPAWPSWNPVCEDAALDGPVEPGRPLDLRFRHPRGRTFHTRPSVDTCERPNRFAWVARATGVRARTDLSLVPTDSGTRVELTTSTSGPMAFSYRWLMRPRTQALLYGAMLGGLVERFE